MKQTSSYLKIFVAWLDFTQYIYTINIPLVTFTGIIVYCFKSDTLGWLHEWLWLIFLSYDVIIVILRLVFTSYGLARR